MTKINTTELNALTAALGITVNKKIAGPLLANLYKEVRKTFPFFSEEINKIVEQLDSDTWYKNEEMLEHIVVIEDNERVSIFFSEELAKAYLNVSIKTLPIMSVLYTSYMNIVSVVKLAGISEASEKLNSLINKVRSKKEEPAVAVKRAVKPRSTKAATKAAE